MPGLQVDGPAVRDLHRRPPPLDEGDEPLDVQRVRRLALQAVGGRERGASGSAGLARRDQAEVRRQHVDLGQAGPRGGVGRIEADGLLERAERPGVVLDRVPQVAASQVAAVGLEVARRRPGRHGVRARGQPGLHRLDHPRGDLVLHGEDVRVLAVEPLGPQVETGGHVGELGRDAQPAAGRAHAAVEDMAHRQRAGDRRRVAALALRAEGRGARRHPDPVDPDERVHDLLGHPLAEVILVPGRAHVGERQHRDRNRSARRIGGGRGHRSVEVGAETRLVQSLHQVLDQPRVEPLLEELASGPGEVGLGTRQRARRGASGLHLAELAMGGGQDDGLPGAVRQVGLHGFVHRAAVVGHAVLVDREDEAVPAGMMGVLLHRPADEPAPALPVPGEGDEEDGLVAAVERIERQGPLGGAPAPGDVPSEEQGDGEGLLGDVVRRREIDGPPSRGEGAVERPGPGVEAVGVLVRVDPGEHRPAVGVGGRPLDSPLERHPRRRMLLGGQPEVVPEAAHERLVGAQLVEWLLPNGVADGPREHAEVVGGGGDDAGYEVVLDGEDAIGLEGPGVGLRPEVGARARVDQLHRDAQLPAGVPEAALHHVARARLPGDGGRVGRPVRVPRRGPAREDPQVGEAREPGDDLLGQAFREGLQARAPVPERQHRHPEALVGARGARQRRTGMRPGGGCRRRGGRLDLQPRLAPAVDQVLHVLGRPPLAQRRRVRWRRSPAAPSARLSRPSPQPPAPQAGRRRRRAPCARPCGRAG